MPMELPPTPFYRRWSVLMAGILGVAAVVALLGWRGLQEVASPAATTLTSVTVTTQAPPPTETTALPPIEPTSKPDDVLWEVSNSRSGTLRSRPFRAPSTWRIEWAFNCSNFDDFGGGNFKITGNGAFQQIQIDNHAIRANGSRRFNRGGYGHLYVETVCKRWTVRVLAG
jgi:hypothetical protein